MLALWEVAKGATKAKKVELTTYFQEAGNSTAEE